MKGFQDLSNLAIKIALEQTSNWTNRLYAQILIDKTLACEGLLNTLITRQVTVKRTKLRCEQVGVWAMKKVDALQALLRRVALLGETYYTFERYP